MKIINANVGLRIIDIALPLLSLYSRITTRVWRSAAK